MKSVGEILRSPGFKREVSLLLFFFAAFSGLYSVIILGGRPSDPDVLAIGVATFIQAILNLVLAIMIRRGSNKALCAAGTLFGLDTLLMFFSPFGQGLAAMLLWRGILVYMLVRYIRKQRVVTS